MAEDPGKDTRIVPVKGRSIVVHQLTDAQLLLMSREARLARREETESDRRFTAVARIFDILESVVVQESDKEYLMDLTVAGALELKDLLDFISAFSDDKDEEKPKVRRGRYATKPT
jgi:hypothetical protein